jgi:hypothetical protein
VPADRGAVNLNFAELPAGWPSSADLNGYMEGAAETGERAANERWRRIGRRS